MKSARVFLGTGAVFIGTGVGPSAVDAQPPRLSSVFESVEASPHVPYLSEVTQPAPRSNGKATIGRLVACAGMGALLGSALGSRAKAKRGLGVLMTPASGAFLGAVGCLVLNPPRSYEERRRTAR